MKANRLLAASLIAVSTLALPQAYPDKSKPIRIVVPFGAGSGADLMARAYGRAMNEQAGVTVIVENKAGAEGVIGVEAAKHAAPDGYTILHANSSTHVLNALMLQKLPYDPVADFIPVYGVAAWSVVLNAGPSTKFRSVKEVIEAARANPGKLSYGSATTSTRLAMEMLEHLGNIKLLSVPYKSQAQATAALAGGEIDLLVTDVSTAIPHYQSGRLRPLGVTGAKPLVALPNVPTIREQGVEKYEFTAWSAMFLPANTPPAVVSYLSSMMRDASKSKYVTEARVLNSSDPLPMDTAQLSTLIRSELDRWGRLLGDTKKSQR
jgi:tripartite-type tricarboxylate transporter receptor subunit TctC